MGGTLPLAAICTTSHTRPASCGEWYVHGISSLHLHLSLPPSFLPSITHTSVDATADNGRKGRLLNHSRTSANVVTKLMEVDDKPYLCLVATRDISVGEELEYDYGERNKEALDSHPWLAT